MDNVSFEDVVADLIRSVEKEDLNITIEKVLAIEDWEPISNALYRKKTGTMKEITKLRRTIKSIDQINNIKLAEEIANEKF